jgi:membrane fusion protein, multidrug efflux system
MSAAALSHGVNRAQALLRSIGARRSIGRLALGAVILCLFVAAALYFYLARLVREVTEDAAIQAHVISVMPRVQANVASLAIDDNTPVRAGDLLVKLDPNDYRVEVEAARATLAAAEGRLAEAEIQLQVAAAEIGQDQADVEIAHANAQLAADNFRRVQGVSDVRAVSLERVDTARAAAASTRASEASAKMKLASAQARAKLNEAQVRTARAVVDKAKAGLDQAELNLSYTRIYAEVNGSVANKKVEVGNYVQPGQLLLSIVPDEVFVVANFKETQMDRIRPGQQATIRVDAFPEQLLQGHVDSIQRGSGSRFALLPPENATGNFVKVVQRIPVKIRIDAPKDQLHLLAPGMSVEVSVFFSQGWMWLDGIGE